MKNKTPLLHTNVCVTTIMILTVAASPAETVTWDGITDLSWTNPDSTSWTGGTYDNGDDAQFLGSGAGTVTLSGTINPGSITVNSANNYTFAGSAIGGAGTLTKDGTGTLSLRGTVANTYTGGTTINDGTMSLGSGASEDALGSGTVTVNSGADLKLWIDPNGSYTIDNAFTLDGGTVYSEDGQYDLTGAMTLNAGGGTLGGKWENKYLKVSGVISGAGDLTVEDSDNGSQIADVILSGVNTYTGNTAIGNNVVLQIAGAGKLDSGNYAGSISNSGTLEYNSSANQTLSGVISGTGALIKDNTGTVTLGGTVANTYSGGTTINDGIVSLGNNSGAANSHQDALGTGAVSVNSGGELRLWISNGGSYTIDNAFTLDGGSVYSEDGQYDLTGDMTLAAGGGTLGGKWGDKYLKVSGVISGTGGLTIVDVPSVQTGDVILTANNTYTGGTTVDSGTLTLTGSGRIGNGGLTVNNGGTLSVATNAFNSLGGAITVNEGGTLSTDSTGQNAHNIGAIALNGGTLTSSGNAYAEGNWIFNGDVTVGGNALSTISGLAVGSKEGGGTFNVADSVTGSGTDLLVTASMVDASGGSFLTKTGAGTMELRGFNTYTGGTTVNEGTLDLVGQGIIDGALTVDGSSSLVKLSATGINGMGRLNSLTLSNGGTFTDNGITGGLHSVNGPVVFDGGGTMTSEVTGQGGFGNFLFIGGITVTDTAGLATISADSISFNFGETLNVADSVVGSGTDLLISSSIRNERIGTNTKNGTGKLTLTGENVDASAWTINAGTLEIGGSGVLESGSYAGAIANNATFEYNSSSDQTMSGVISGAGALVKDNSGTMTLTGANTYTGATNVNGGTLAFTGSGTISESSAIVINDTGTLRFDKNDTWGNADTDTSSSITINAGGTIESNGFFTTIRDLNLNGGTVALTGGANPTYPALALKGTVTVGGSQASQINYTSGNFSRISIGDNNLGATVFDVADATSDASADLTIAAVVQNNGPIGGNSLTKTGAGTMELTSANTYTGTTTVNAGTLSLATGSSHSGSGAYTVNGGILEIATGVDLSAHAMTIGIGGVISPGNSPGTASTGAQTWNDGGSYLWEINDSDGSKGGTNGWDWLDITGALDLSALTVGGFTIDIDSLTSGNIAGDAVGFDTWTQGDGNSDYSFIIATASSGITGFDAADFILDSSGFSNAPSWEWGIVLSGGDLVLEAYALPEPSSTALLGLGGLALMLRRKRS